VSAVDAPETLLDVRDLRVEIPTPRGVVRAVDGASFSLRRGGSLGLVGESGCGKSMTLRAILGLLPTPGHVAGGAVEFDGRDLTTLPRDELRALRGRGIGMIFQEPMTALNPVMRVGDQIAEGPLVRLGHGRRGAAARALELMREVGIPDPKRRYQAYPHELSGGMRQRVMIAIAIACEPSLVLCDEPTTALDVTIQDQILKLLARLCRDHGASIVFVTHDLAVIAQTCETVAVMYAGRVVETGTVDAVFREPRHPYTLALLRSVPDALTVRDRLVSIPGRPPDLVAPPPGCAFAPRCALALETCTHGDFPLRPVSAGRTSACVRDEECAADARRDPVVA
jgi:oligopeptide/dipeptide ABC transporter ATP-binding protein